MFFVGFVSVLRLPLVLVQEADFFFDIGREVTVLRDKILLLLSFEIVHRIQNSVKSQLKLAILFAVLLVKEFGKLNDR